MIYQLLIIFILLPHLCFATVRCTNNLTGLYSDFPTDGSTLEHIRDVYNYNNVEQNSSYVCVDLETSHTFNIFQPPHVTLRMFNRYVAYEPKYTASIFDQELGEIRALTSNDWGVIILALVGVMAVSFVIVQIKNVLKRT